MLKNLILPVLALALSFSARAQLKAGLAADYEHIQAHSLYDLGSGSGWGAGLFFHYPFHSRWGLDWSADLAGGSTRVTYYYYPTVGVPGLVYLAHDNRSFIYFGVPVHLVYSIPFRKGRVFAGPGISWSYLNQTGILESYYEHTQVQMIAASVKAGCRFLKSIVLSGEFRPWVSVINKPRGYSNPSNLLSVKLGFEFERLKHSRGAHSGS
jgi:hypothetical protein